MLFAASQVMPPVMAPSPTTTTVVRSFWPVSAKAREMPSAQDSDDEACEDSTTSCSDSPRSG